MTNSKTNKEPEIEYTKYLVGFDPMGRHVEIYLDGNKPTTGHRTVGEFEANAVEGKLKGEEDFDTHGDHILIAAAKAVLEDLEIVDFDNMAYEDKASNAPQGTSYIPTISEVEAAVRNNESPADYQERVSDNLDKAEAKLEKASKKAGTKNDAKPRSKG